MLENSLKLCVLENDGVDNWTGFMAGKKEFMTKYFGEDLDFEEAARRDLVECFADKEIF